MTHSPPIEIKRGNQTFAIQSDRGVITFVDTTPGATIKVATRVVGAGIALAATAGGRYIIAIAPRSARDPNESSAEPVVYTVTW
jgi:hypothetical protein